MLLLTRILLTKEAIYGYLRHPLGLVLATVEQPWRNNEPNISCVPIGDYTLEPHSSDQYQDVWALVNHDLGIAHYPTPGVPRSACLIHAANVYEELRGCIAPGTKFEHLKIKMYERSLGVKHSFDALEQLRRAQARRYVSTLRIENLPWVDGHA